MQNFEILVALIVLQPKNKKRRVNIELQGVKISQIPENFVKEASKNEVKGMKAWRRNSVIQGSCLILVMVQKEKYEIEMICFDVKMKISSVTPPTSRWYT